MYIVNQTIVTGKTHTKKFSCFPSFKEAVDWIKEEYRISKICPYGGNDNTELLWYNRSNPDKKSNLPMYDEQALSALVREQDFEDNVYNDCYEIYHIIKEGVTEDFYKNKLVKKW